jgi:phage terminase small subunit
MRVIRTRRARATQDEQSRKSVLGHVEHLRSIGEAFIRAADTYVTEHQISDAESDWQTDFSRNISEAGKEFHRAIAESSVRVQDIFFGTSEDVAESEAPPIQRPVAKSRRPRTRSDTEES